MLVIENLQYSYKKAATILSDINLRIDRGFCFLVGENGSGKSTLLKNIANILRGNGEISINGVSWDEPSYNQKLAYLPQDFDIYPNLRVNEVLEFVAGLKGIAPSLRTEQVRNAAHKLNLESYLKKRMKECSGGMRRRVGIATTLIGAPEVVLLDEPTAGIDPKERFQFYQSLKEYFNDKIVLISTHILDDAEYLADSIIMLSHGVVKYQDSYHVFRHSLDGKVYELICPKQELRNIASRYTLLDYAEQPDGEILCRLVIDNCNSSAGHAVQATIGDLWLYYQGDMLSYER